MTYPNNACTQEGTKKKLIRWTPRKFYEKCIWAMTAMAARCGNSGTILSKVVTLLSLGYLKIEPDNKRTKPNLSVKVAFIKC